MCLKLQVLTKLSEIEAAETLVELSDVKVDGLMCRIVRQVRISFLKADSYLTQAAFKFNMYMRVTLSF